MTLSCIHSFMHAFIVTELLVCDRILGWGWGPGELLEFELGTLHLLGRHITTSATPPAQSDRTSYAYQAK
jgi:hypothetical protein